MATCLEKRPAFISICVYMCLFSGCLLHSFGTHALRQIVVFMSTNWQPTGCSCALSHRDPSAARRGRSVRDSGLAADRQSHTSSSAEPLSLTLKGAGTVLCPCLTLAHLHSLNDKKPGRWEKMWHFPIFSLSKELLIAVTIEQRWEGTHKQPCLLDCALQTLPHWCCWMARAAPCKLPLATCPLQLPWNKSTQQLWRSSCAFTPLLFQCPSMHRGPAHSHLCALAGCPGTQLWRESWQPCFY